MTGDPEPAAWPLLTVLRGEPTPQPLAALVAVVSRRAVAAAEEAGAAEPSPWARPVLRAPLSPGPGAWRTSGLPH